MTPFTGPVVTTALIVLVGLVALAWHHRPRRAYPNLHVPGTVAPGMPTLSGPTPLMPCPICHAKTHSMALLDFNKTCEDIERALFPKSGVPIEYLQCEGCGFIFAPMFQRWTLKDFETWIYNSDYPLTDPDYLIGRPTAAANFIDAVFGSKRALIRHLDYGGGNGELTRVLRSRGWDSTSYDPFVDPDVDVTTLGRFDIITAIEVIEHVPDPQSFMKTVMDFLNDDGVIVISTLLSDGELSHAGLDWWYAAPRNGHISLYSASSLGALSRQHGFEHRSFGGMQALIRKSPAWAPEMFPS